MASARSVTIAVVDDEPSIRKALVRLLRAAGYEAREFASGPEFLRTLPDYSYGCLVLDLQMAGMSGIDVQLDRTFLEFALPVVNITAHDGPGARQQCLAAGACAYLCKPFDDQELLQAVGDAIDSWTQADAGASAVLVGPKSNRRHGDRRAK
jgi:FixJ family two-component response regulator